MNTRVTLWVALATGALSVAPVAGGVVASFNAAQDTYVGAPDVTTIPTADATVGENNFGTPRVAGQTFTATETGDLDSIQLYVSGTAETFNLHVYDLGAGFTIQPNTTLVPPGSDLVSASFTSTTSGDPGILTLSFDDLLGDDDRPELTAGRVYYVELEGTSGGPLTWNRGGAGANSDGGYAAGDAFRNRQLLNGARRDFAMAVNIVPIPEPATVGVVSLAGLGWLARRRRA